jgi:hypothetical protein
MTRTTAEIALLVVLLFTTNNFSQENCATMSKHCPLPLQPLIVANDMDVYGRLNFSESHAHAMIKLVQRLGGLNAVRIPGLAATIALADLMEASKQCRKPVFPSFWFVDRSVLLVDRTFLLGNGQAPDRGFFTQTSNALPASFLRLLVQLATGGDTLAC